jgi:hypothetical protein
LGALSGKNCAVLKPKQIRQTFRNTQNTHRCQNVHVGDRGPIAIEKEKGNTKADRHTQHPYPKPFKSAFEKILLRRFGVFARGRLGMLDFSRGVVDRFHHQLGLNCSAF